MKIEEKIKLILGLSSDELFSVVEANLQELVVFYTDNSVYLKNSPVLIFIEAKLEELEEHKDDWNMVHDINDKIVDYIERLKSKLPDLKKSHNKSIGRKRKYSDERKNSDRKIIDKHESLRG